MRIDRLRGEKVAPVLSSQEISRQDYASQDYAGQDYAHQLSAHGGPSDPFATAKAEESQRRLRVLDVIASGVLGLAAVAMVVNALALQSPHPAGMALPLPRPAGTPEEKHATAPEKPAEKAKVAHATAEPQRPVQRGEAEGSLGYLATRISNGLPASVPQRQASASAPAKAQKTASNGDVTGAIRPPSNVATTTRLLSVQKALAKLGYGPLRLDGRPGTETRLAIQRFERDRNLPVDGEISERFLKELASVSGGVFD